MSLVGSRRYDDSNAMVLDEHRDRVHVHLEPVLGPHSPHRFLTKRIFVGRRLSLYW
jgi:hypothetical protein